MVRFRHRLHLIRPMTSGSMGVRSTAGGTPGTRGPNFRDNTDPNDGQSPGGNPATIGEASIGGCDSQPVEHQCVL
jgi:hypothetical protein